MALIEDRELAEKFEKSTRTKESRNLVSQPVRLRLLWYPTMEIAPLALSDAGQAGVVRYLSGKKILTAAEVREITGVRKLGIAYGVLDFDRGLLALVYDDS